MTLALPRFRRRGLALLVACALPLGAPAGAAAAALAQAAPDFTLPSAAGPNLRLQEQRGRVVMLNFWATWCGPCRREMPQLNRLYTKYKSSGFVLVGVNVDDDPRNAVGVSSKLGVQFPVVFDSAKRVSHLYDLDTMPSTVLIDRDGRVRFIHPRLPRRPTKTPTISRSRNCCGNDRDARTWLSHAHAGRRVAPPRGAGAGRGAARDPAGRLRHRAVGQAVRARAAGRSDHESGARCTRRQAPRARPRRARGRARGHRRARGAAVAAIRRLVRLATRLAGPRAECWPAGTPRRPICPKTASTSCTTPTAAAASPPPGRPCWCARASMTPSRCRPPTTSIPSATPRSTS